MNIRLETIDDYRIVEEVTRKAFWNVYRPGCFEHYVIHNLRKSNQFIPDLSYVLEDEGKIIGNIVYIVEYLQKDDGEKVKVAMFGPVSILPEYQGRGYGSRLITYTLAKAERLGYKAILITGNPEYYQRFGFESASKYHIYYEGIEKTEEAPFFMVKFFTDDITSITGTYYLSDFYKVDEDALGEYDKTFEKITDK